MMKLPVTSIWTHDGVGVGEAADPPGGGATGRSPGHSQVRPVPSPAMPTRSWKPGALPFNTRARWVWSLSRQPVPTYNRQVFASAQGVHKGAYVINDARAVSARVILIGTGTELQVCINAQALLEAEGIATRVVSIPSWELLSRAKQGIP